MPSAQRGSVLRLGACWGVRYYDENGVRRRQAGFETRREALAWLNRKLEEVGAFRRGERPRPTEIPTVKVLVANFLAGHEVDPSTTTKLRHELNHAVHAFGEKPIDTLTAMELQSWRMTLPTRSRAQLFRSFKQTLEQAVTWGLLERNPAERIKNRRSPDGRREQRPFESWEEVEALAEELDPRFAALPIFLVGTGLRPEEALALERRDFDRGEGVVSIERVYSQGRVKACKKSDRQRRRVPLRAKVLEALDAGPRRIDSPLLFPSARGVHIDLGAFRDREWTPALRAAGLDHRGVYACRHTFATWAIRSGMHLHVLARVMGTSVSMIDQHYGHLLRDNDEYVRRLLESWDEQPRASRAT